MRKPLILLLIFFAFQFVVSAQKLDQNGKTDQLKFDQPNNDFWFYELDLHRTK
jgi:hypothetical protein